MSIFFFCLILICTPVLCKLEASVSLFPFSSSLLAWDIEGTHMVISTNTSTSHLEFYDFDTQYLTVFPYPNLAGIVMVSTHELNKNESYCIVYQINATYTQRISQNSICTNGTTYNFNVMLKSWGFGQNPGSYYLSYPTISGSELWWVTDVSYTNAYFTPYGYEVVYHRYYNDSIFYVSHDMGSRISPMVLSIYHSNFGAFEINGSYSYSNCSRMTIDVYLGYLAVNCGDYVQIRSSYQPYTFLANITLNDTAEAIAIVNNFTLITVTSTQQVRQFQLPDGVLLDVNNISLTAPYKIKRVGADRFYIFNTTHGVLYNTSLVLACPDPCNCTNQFFQQWCVQPIINNPSNFTWGINNSSVPANSSFAPANSSNFNSSISPSASPVSPTSTASTVSAPTWAQSLRVGSQAIGNSLAIMSIRMTMKSNIPLSLFMDEFWLYKYYVGITYPEGMTIFMSEVEIVSYLKLNPAYMQFLSTNYSIGSSSYFSNVYTSNFTTYSPLYFTQAIKQSCISSIVMSVGIFILLKFAHILSRKYHKKNRLTKVIYEALKERTEWWILLIGIVEPNFLVVCLFSLNQISLPFSFCFENKINLVAAVASYLILVLYSLVAYTLLYENYRNKTASLLIISKYKSIRSYSLESSLMLTVKIFKCFAHSVLLATPFSRLILLSGMDYILIICIITYRKSFYNKLHFFIYLLYQVGVCMINTLLALRQTGLINSFYNFEEIVDGLMISLLIIVALKLLLVYFKATQEVCAAWFPNKVRSVQKPPQVEICNKQKQIIQKRHLETIKPQIFSKEEYSNQIQGIFRTNNKSRFILKIRASVRKQKDPKNYDLSKFAPKPNPKNQHNKRK